MFKVVWLLKRKKGMTHAQFREQFEHSHAPLAQKYIGHLLSEYRRNYLSDIGFGDGANPNVGGYQVRDWAWDLLSEWVMPNEDAFKEVMRIMTEPRISKEFQDDSGRFSDREATVMIRCDVVDTGTGDGHGAPWR